MGLFDNSQFLPPTSYNTGPSFRDLVHYKDQERQKQLDFQKNLLDFQSNLRLSELAKSARMQQDMANQQEQLHPHPEQVVYRNLNYLDPYKQAQLEQNASKIDLTRQNNEAKNEIARQNANTKADLADNPDVVQVKTAGGNVVTLDRKSGRIVDTGISQGTQTAADAAATKLNNEVSLENTKEGNRIASIEARGKQTLANTRERAEQARQTKTTASPNTSINLPSQQAVASKLAAQQFINKNPELGKYVHIDPNTGLVSIDPPSAGTGMFSFGKGGPSRDDYQKILNVLYPNGTTSVNEGLAAAPNNQTGDTDIILEKNGQRFRLKNPSKLNTYLQQGYKRIQ